MTRSRRHWWIAPALMLGFGVLSVPLVGQTPGAATTVTAYAVIPSDIPVGAADDNDETSRGISAILDNCVRAYDAIENFHSRGRYVAVNKRKDGSTTHAQSLVTVDYRGPDHLAIHSKSKVPSIECSFVADGTTVTMASGETRLFRTMAQPASLAAFADGHRAGEIYGDASGALAVAAFPALLISENTRAIMHDGITRYLYEGREKADGTPCHRVRFIQDDPAVIVILWIDEKSFLIRKTSLVYSYNEDYEMVDSFQEGKIARMMVMTWDELTTAPGRVDKKAFQWKRPARYKRYRKPAPTPNASDKPGLWESLVSTAAKSTPEPTTWTLTREAGSWDVSVREFTHLPQPSQDIAGVVLPGKQPALLVADEKGRLHFFDDQATTRSTLDLGSAVTSVKIMETTTGELMQVLAVGPEDKAVMAWDAAGKLLWEYSYPYSTILRLSTPTAEPGAYVVLSGAAGVRKLTPAGQVDFASNKLMYGAGVRTASPGIDRLLYPGAYQVAVMDKKLNLVNTVETDELLVSVQWEGPTTGTPITSLALSSDNDVLLQRRDVSGEVAWTITLAPKADKVSGTGLTWLNLPGASDTGRCIFAGLSDGRFALVSETGTILYRGRLTADAATIERNGGSVIGDMALADLNADGADELYVKLDTYLLRMDVKPGDKP